MEWNVIRFGDHRSVLDSTPVAVFSPIWHAHSNAYVYPVNLLWNAKRFVYYNSHYTTNKWDVSTKRKIETLLFCVCVCVCMQAQLGFFSALLLGFIIILVGKFTCILSNNPICYATFACIHLFRRTPLLCALIDSVTVCTLDSSLIFVAVLFIQCHKLPLVYSLAPSVFVDSWK